MSEDLPQDLMQSTSVDKQLGSSNQMPMPDRVTIRLLILAAVAEDAEVVACTMRDFGYFLLVRTSATHADFMDTLVSFHPNIIILNCKLPDFGGLSMVQAIREQDREIPIILVAGAHEDEAAVELVKAGATDFVRTDRMARLPIAFASALALTANKTERWQAVHALRQSVLDLEDLYNNAPCGYHSTNRELTVVSINDTELRWLGYQRSEVVGKMRIVDLLTPDSASRFRQQAFPRLQATGEVRDLELDMVRKDGSKFPAAFEATVISGPNGDFVSDRTIVRDISAIKVAERRERKSAGTLRDILYSLDLAIIFLDANLDVQFMSPAAEARFGIKSGDTGELLIAKIVGRLSANAADELRTKAIAVMQSCVSTETEVASELHGRFGLRLSPYQSTERDAKGVVVTFVDKSSQILEIGRVKAFAQEAEFEILRLRSILDCITAGIIVADADGNIIQVNRAAQRMHGQKEEPWRLYEFKPETWHTKQVALTTVEQWLTGFPLCKLDRVTTVPDELNPLLRALRGENVSETLLYLKQPDGLGTNISVSGCPIHSTDGSISGALVVLTDATEYSWTVESLKSEMVDVRRLLEANFHPQLAINLDENITDVTKAMELATGVSRSRLMGSNFSHYFTEPEAARAAYRDTLAKGSINNRALAIRHVFGTVRDFHCDARTYRDESSAVIGVLVVARDVTEEKRAARQASFAESVRNFRDGRA